VWRNSIALSQSASKLGNALSATYDDYTMTPGTVYYYWVKSRSTVAESGFSAVDRGYAATGAVDVTVWDLVALPTVIPAGSHPKVMSLRLQNNGPSELIAPNTAMGLTFYMGRTTDINQAVAVGLVNQDVTVAAGTSTVVKVNSVSGVTMPSEAGDYYIFVQAAPVWPNRLADESQGGNTAMGVGRIRVTEGGTAHYWGVNDYDGDGISDLAVYERNQGMWSVRTADGRVLGANVPFGRASATPAVGDYDGDGKADPAIYYAGIGLWNVMLSGSGYMTASATLGAVGYEAVPGDYDGDGKADPVVHNESSGIWEGFLSGSGYSYAVGQFGAAGYRPVPGDYNGDGIWDLA
ncbi:MAG: VCBS repeat-containing protein, partial [Kiritimatiellae bacterium]|nr:VCBS repeat-containing protein [Kiritimatiellia bacterium]